MSGSVNAAPGNAAALGGLFGAKSGGRMIRVAEGGYDEVVLTTDPSQRGRMSHLMSAYMQMSGVTASMADGGFTSGFRPSMSARGTSSGGGGRNVTVNLTQEIHTNDPKAFQRSARQNARAARGALGTVMN